MDRRERDELMQFLQPLLRARATDRDLAAETLILQQCAGRPDALYLMVQRAMALEVALQAAHARVAELQGVIAAQGAGQDPVRATALAREEAGDRPGAWGRGLLAQAATLGAGVGLGVTAGVVAGGLLLDAADDWFSGDL